VRWTCLALIVVSVTIGEVLQAAGMRRHGEIHDFSPGELGRALALVAHNRFVIGSVFAMAIGFFANMGLLSVSELSFAVPATAVTSVLARYYLKERVNWLRWTGASLVICGVVLVAL